MIPPMDARGYADAVRAALADLPVHEREELLEDLDDHLAEIAAESEVPLEDRLGPPEAYAEELRAAYGGRPARPRPRLGNRLRSGAGSLLRTAHVRLLALPPYRQAAAFMPELRPAWWVLRGYALALVLLWIGGRAIWLVPGSPVSWVFTLVIIWASVWLGRRPEPGASRWGRVLLLGANVAAAMAVSYAVLSSPSYSPVRFDDAGPRAAPVRVESVASMNGVYNILPYAADGTPLQDVRLYDQDGNPIITSPEMHGHLVLDSCDGKPPMRNVYPLPLRAPDEVFGDEGTRNCVTPSPSWSPGGTPSPALSPSSPPSSPSAPSSSSPSPSTAPAPKSKPTASAPRS